MKHHRKTVGKHTQKKNGMRKTMKGGYWFYKGPDDSVTKSSDTSAPAVVSSSAPSIYDKFLSFFSSKKTDTPVTPVTPPPQPINNTETGGYMGGKRKGKTAKKPCPKKGGGK